MANPITSINRRLVSESSYDIADAARRQDIERRIREDNEYFERTGINRHPIREYSPLVDNDNRPDIANDGDFYDDRHTAYTENGWAEDTPTRLLDPDYYASDSRLRDLAQDSQAIHGIDVSREINAYINQREAINGRNLDTLSNNDRIRASRTEREAYMHREQIIKDREFLEKSEKRKTKFNNAIQGLELDEE